MIGLSSGTSIETPTYRFVSYEEYLRLAQETHIAEWVNGEFISYMPPTLKHQEITWFLFHLLSGFVQLLGLGTVGSAPFEIKLWVDGPSREPDIFFIGNDKLSGLSERRFDGAPDLVVEVVSPSSVREDKARKFAEYEDAHVNEYWLLDPRPRQRTADFFQLDQTGIYQAVSVAEDGRYNSLTLPGFSLNVDWLWQDPLPNYQRLLAQIMAEQESISPELRQLYRQLAASLK
jgi:Uma2 family endonuclease